MRLARSILRRLNPPRQYASYAEAMAECDGYEDADIVGTVYAKTVANRSLPLTSTNAFTLLSLLMGRKVVDFGGACGAEYFNARRIAPSWVKLDWTVVETPAMVARASALANGELRFSTSLDGLSADVLHTSGTLQCTPDPIGYLRKLIDFGAEHMVLNRIGLSAGPQVVTVQTSMLSWNGPGPMPDGIADRAVRYPVTFPNVDEFMDALSSRYELVTKFVDNTALFPVRGAKLIGGGMVFRRHS